MGTDINHRLDRKDISSPNFGALARYSVIWNLRIFVHPTPNPMTNVVANHRITMRLSMLLDSIANVTKMIADAALIDCQFQAFPGNAQQFPQLIRYAANRNSRCCVA